MNGLFDDWRLPVYSKIQADPAKRNQLCFFHGDFPRKSTYFRFNMNPKSVNDA